ncbi:MAG: IS3 family transposase [Planctomycetia bacterium]|nr:IS3 family transposase [Planctomycetia bacterium]
MSKRRVFTREFKVEAVALVSRQGLSFAETARRLEIGQSLLRKWQEQLAVAGSKAFAAKSQPSALEEENRRLRAENDRLRMEREILKKATAFLREGVAMRYAFIERHRTVWPIVIQCEVLRVSRSGFYSWRKRPPSATATRRAALTQEVREVHRISRETYGAARVHQALGQRGTKCDRKTVAKVMREAGIRSKTSRKFRVTTTDSNHPHPVAANVLARDFTADKANQKWVADITYIATLEGWLYLAAVLDLFTRKVVGWSMSERIDSRLAVDALEMAVSRQLPDAGLIAHSDRGVQYASEHYQRTLTTHGIECSMSRRGDCWDNAPAESFFATLKKELVHHEVYETRTEARASLFEYIEVFYNRQRLHSSLGYVSPADFEAAAA